MRRSICITEPAVARAGEINTWKFHYTTSVPLAKGAQLKFDMQNLGRDIDWEPPTVDLNEEANLIYALLENGEMLTAAEVETPDRIVPQYQFTLPAPLKIGQKITVVIGAPNDADEEELISCGNMSQLTIQRRRPFLLYIDPKGKGNYDEPEAFAMDIRGGKLHTIKILTPSFVAKNKRFDITVRFEDEYGNLTSNAPEGTLIDLSYEHLRENLNWKLFVPETGFVILPNLYFNEAGVYRIQLLNLMTQEKFISAPIKCFQENDKNLFWGLLHGESERVDSTENIESCLRHFRDDCSLNYFSTSPFESVEETSNDTWKLLVQNVQEFNEEDRFAALLGMQFQGDKTEGLRQFVYSKDNKPLLRQKDSKSSSLIKIYKGSSPKDLLSIPSFTMGQCCSFDFETFNPEFERVVEIYNAWGSSEMTRSAGNTRPITGGVEEAPEGSLVEALKKGYRFGFVAGGLDDRGVYADFFASEQAQYTPGLTAVMCERYTREAIFDALYRRSCYATSGARIIVGFYLAGHPMGSELSSAQKPGLTVNRHLSGFLAGTTPLKLVEIVRNGEVLHTFQPSGYHYDYYFDDMDPLDKITLSRAEGTPFAFYYLRVTQEDGHTAWSSPIWVDYEKAQPAKGKK